MSDTARCPCLLKLVILPSRGSFDKTIDFQFRAEKGRIPEAAAFVIKWALEILLQVLE